MSANYSVSRPEIFENPKDFQDSPRERLTRDSYWYNHVSVIGGLKADLNERIQDGIQEIVAHYLEEMMDPEDGNYDLFTAIKMLQRAGFGKYLPPIQRD